MFVMFVKNSLKISIMHRITQDVIADPEELPSVLQQYAGLFDAYAEEDVGYRQIQLLQDAGILPVDDVLLNPTQDQFTGGQRPRGVSANVPQHVIDDMMREH